MLRKNVDAQKVTFSLFKSGARIASPTIAAGDFKVDLDGGGQNNVTTPPTSDAAGLVTWLPSQAETNGTYITLLGNDAAGAEWEPITISFDTSMETVLAAVALGIVGADGDTLETLSDQLDGVATLGAGAVEEVITVTDGTDPLDGAEVWASTDSGGSNIVASGSTDASGEVTFMLDAGTYYVWVQHAGYNATNPTEVTVS